MALAPPVAPLMSEGGLVLICNPAKMVGGGVS